MSHRQISLSTKLYLITVLLLCSLFATVGAALHVLARVEVSAAELTVLREAQRKSQHADMLHDAIRNSVLDLLLAAGSDNKPAAQLAEAQAQCASFGNELSAMSSMPLAPELQSIVGQTHEIVSAYSAQAARMAYLATANRGEAFAELHDFDKAFDAAKDALERQTDELGKASQIAAANRARAGQDAQRWLLVTGLLSSVLSFALVILIARSIRRSLERLRDVARAVAEGELDKRAEVRGADEIGVLGDSVNRMADHLQKTIERMRAEADRGAFSAKLVDAFDMADSEPEAIAVVERAMLIVSPDHPMEMLIADSSKAHLERAAEHPSAGSPGCTVESPFSCVAVRRGNLVVFDDSEALNACPHLRRRSSGPCSAACVPVAFMGHSLGVLHATGPVGRPLSYEQEARLRTLGMQTGGRIGTVRAFQRTQLQASTDALTGLLNRRAMEEAMRDVTGGSERFALLLADLDHFKRLNDEHGHPAGDSALRLFSEVLRSMVRPSDLAARWGGEEFCVVLSDSGAGEAVGWADRVREKLAASVTQACSPTFTASFGVADSTLSRKLPQLMKLADEALYRAKREGRNRVAVADTPPVSGKLVRQESEQRAAINLRMVSDVV